MECPICLSYITDIEKDVVTTNCGHTFHTSCLIRNVLQNGANCPYCRADTTIFHESEEVEEEQEYDIHRNRRQQEQEERVRQPSFVMAPDLHMIARQLMYRNILYEDLVACLLWKEHEELRIEHDIAREDYFRKYIEIMDKLYIINEVYPRVRRDN